MGGYNVGNDSDVIVSEYYTQSVYVGVIIPQSDDKINGEYETSVVNVICMEDQGE